MSNSFHNQILTTKLYPPPFPSDYVVRQNLEDKLSQVIEYPLILLSAPAGYGKSSLVSNFLSNKKLPFAWLSLDSEENDFNRFLEYLAATVKIANVGLGKELEKIIKLPKPISAKEVVVVILNDLQLLKSDFILVIDDYHLITNKEIHDLVEQFLKFPSGFAHLVLISRNDPPLPIHQYRIKNKILEIRTKDLAFTTADTTIFLNRAFDIKVSNDTATHISQGTEGWIAGLKMLVLSKKGNEFKEGDLKFTELSSYFLPQLIQDVLNNQSEEIRQYLLYSSILKQFSGELCEYLAGENSDLSGKGFIEVIEKSNLFIIAMDDQVNWFRYHHLFADLLLEELKSSYNQSEIQQLHFKAANWFAKNRMEEFAIKHFIESENIEKAVELFTNHRIDLLRNRKWGQLKVLLNYFPDNYCKATGALLLTNAWLMVYAGSVFDMFEMIEGAKAIIEKEDDNEALIGECNSLRMYKMYHIDQNYELVISCGELALEQLPANHTYPISYVWIFIGGALQALDRTSEAIDRLYKVLDVEKDENIVSHLLLILNYIFWLEGNEVNLKKVANNLYNFGQKQNNYEAIAHGHLFLGVAHYLEGDLDKANKHLEEVMEMNNHIIGAQVFFAATCLASTYLFQKEFAHLGRQVKVIEEMVNTTGGYNFRSYWDALNVELEMHQGNKQEVKKWLKGVHEYPFTPSTNHADPNISLVRILLFDGSDESLAKAIDLIQNLEAFFNKINSKRVASTLSFAKAIYYFLKDDMSNSHILMKRSLTQIENDNVCIILVEFGSLIAPLLDSYQSIVGFNKTLSKALAIINKDGEPLTVDSFSIREKDLLPLLNLANKEIAEKLFIAEKTVKRHKNSIFKKLEVKNWREAQLKVEELELVKVTEKPHDVSLHS